MTFLVIEIQTNTDGTVGNLISAYTERNLAEQKYYTVLAAAAVSTLPTHAVALLTNDGQPVMHAVYRHPVAAPVEPEENTEE